MENTKETTAVKKYNFVEDFCNHLRKGTSVLQKTSKNPSYVVNAITGKPYLGYNMLVANQGMVDAGLKSHVVLSHNQMGNNKNEFGRSDPIYAKKGTQSIGTIFIPNKDAYYTEMSPEVVDGKAKAGDVKKTKDGKPYQTETPYFLYAAVNCQKTELVLQKDKDGKQLYYKENNLSKDEVYDKDKTVTNTRTGETIAVKKGEPKILNFAGSKIAKRVGTGQDLNFPEPKMEPLIKNEMVPLYTRRNDSAKEVLMENLTKFFRGCMNGGFEGCKLSSKEIDSIEKEYKDHPVMFKGICNSALTRAFGNKETIARMDEAVNKKEQTQVKTETKTEENTKSKGKGRS